MTLEAAPDMLWGASSGALEVRSEGGTTRLRATFPYGVSTVLAPGREEVIAARAFSTDGTVHLLSGHDYEKPLASTEAGNLTLRNGDDALEVEATIEDGTSWARDFVAAHKAGLIRGLSPGFRVEPGGEHVTRSGDGLLRTITAARLYEVSAVTRPAYSQAQIEARSWETHQDRQPVRVPSYRMRWRL